MDTNRISIEFASSVYLVILISTLIWCLMIVLAPLFAQMGGVYGNISGFVYWFYSPVCHQDDARSFFIFGNKLAVCSRCSSLYFSFLLGTVIYPFVKKVSDVSLPSVWFLLGAAALMFGDAMLDIFGILKNTHLTRSITGVVLGFVLVFYLVPGFINFIYEIFSFLDFNVKTKRKG